MGLRSAGVQNSAIARGRFGFRKRNVRMRLLLVAKIEPIRFLRRLADPTITCLFCMGRKAIVAYQRTSPLHARSHIKGINLDIFIILIKIIPMSNLCSWRKEHPITVLKRLKE